MATIADQDADAAESKLGEKLARIAKRTHTKRVLAGGATSLVALDAERFPDPVLVTATAGAGDVLHVACELGQHAAPSANLVNACINEIAAHGATPLFFSLRLTAGELDAPAAESIAAGAAEACRSAACTLLGVQTCAAPDLFRGKAYELGGYMTGICSRTRLLSLDAIADGDMLLGLPSNGLHDCGFAEARRLLLGSGQRYDLYVNALHDKIGATLLKPHRNYLSPIRKLIQAGLARGFVPIASNGLRGSLDAALPKGHRAQINSDGWELPPLFTYLKTLSGWNAEEMMQHFNMGIGMVAIVPAPMLEQAQMVLRRMGEKCVVAGRIAATRTAPGRTAATDRRKKS